METSEKQNSPLSSEEKLFTKSEVDSMKASLENEIREKEAKKSSMTELERVQAELDEMKRKYQEKEDECLIAKQKQETQSLLEVAGMPSQMLEVVYTPKDMEATKTKIGILKNYIDEIKNQMLQDDNAALSTLPLCAAGNSKAVDPFLEGFLSA